MTRWRPIAAVVISVLGLGVATYLTYSHYTAGAKGVNSCPFGAGSGGTIDCTAVLTSGWSTILGLPVALYGAVFFVFMIVINLPAMWRSESLLVARLRLAAVCAGMVMVIYLVGVELLAVRHICIWCARGSGSSTREPGSTAPTTALDSPGVLARPGRAEI